MQTLHAKWSISACAFGLLVIHLLWPGVAIDEIVFGLVLLAALPWLPAIIESAELPGGWKVQFRKLESEQQRQQGEIDTLKFLVSHFVTEDELKHLRALASDQPFRFTKDDSASFFETELRRLRAQGLIAGHPGKGVRSLFATNEGDVKDHFYITDQGKAYLTLREQVDAALVADD